MLITTLNRRTCMIFSNQFHNWCESLVSSNYPPTDKVETSEWGPKCSNVHHDQKLKTRDRGMCGGSTINSSTIPSVHLWELSGHNSYYVNAIYGLRETDTRTLTPSFFIFIFLLFSFSPLKNRQIGSLSNNRGLVDQST